MSEVKFVLRDSFKDISSTWHGSSVDGAIAALSADPVTIDELEIAIERFMKPYGDGRWFQCFRGGIDDEPYDAGLVVIDLAARLVVVNSSYSSPGPTGTVCYHDGNSGTDVEMRYALAEGWLFTRDIHNWHGTADYRRRELVAQPPLDTRVVLYGRRLLEFLAAECLTAFARRDEIAAAKDSTVDGTPSPNMEFLPNPSAKTLKDIHASWLLTPCDDLNGQTPRELLLAQHDHISRDMQHRCDQWSKLDFCPRGLDPTSHAFRFGGFGTHELVKYYDLVRELLWTCWERLTELNRSPHLNERPDALSGDDFLAVEVPRLERVRDEWFETPETEFDGRTPRSIIDRERARLPEISEGHDGVIDPDCPCCQMLADMPGPMFWHLDGSGMDWEFAFDLYCRTREEWDKKQREYDEYSRQCDAREEEGRRLGVEFSDDGDFPVGSVWTRSFSLGDSHDVPLGLRLFELSDRIADLIVDLRELSRLPECETPDLNPAVCRSQPVAAQSLIDELSLAFGHLRQVLTDADDSLTEYLLEPVLEGFDNTLYDIEAPYPTLYPKCAEIFKQLYGFLDPAKLEQFDEDIPF